MQQLAMAFDYEMLDTETRIVVQQRTGEIKGLMRKAAQDIIDIGQKLIDVNGRLPGAQFDAWLSAEFAWSRRTAFNFIGVTRQFGSANFALDHVAPSALYLLAAPSTPDEAREEALARAATGEPITHKTAKAIIEEVRQPPASAALDEAPLTLNEASVARRFVDPPLTDEELSALSELGGWELTRIEPDGVVWLRLCRGETWGQEESRSPGGWRYELGVLRDERAQRLAKQAERIAAAKAEADATLKRKRGEPDEPAPVSPFFAPLTRDELAQFALCGWVLVAQPSATETTMAKQPDFASHGHRLTPITQDNAQWRRSLAVEAAAAPEPERNPAAEMMALLTIITNRIDVGCADPGDRQELERLAFRAA
ncbi:MAG: DUF3102 domain-containing protein, partial [Chloroflexia bacterium]|nr:DUF3102 domain-containing protein [Chloroflexia bacterium]